MTTTATELTMFEGVSDSIAPPSPRPLPPLAAPSPVSGGRPRRPQPHDRRR